MKHNLSYTRLYRIYSGIKQRCYNKNSKAYKNYGGRGIKMCDEWFNDFQTFYNWAMENGYSDNLSIDRIDVDKNYCSENCQWLTRSANSSRKRKSGHVKNGLEPVRRNIIINRATKKGEPEYFNYKLNLPAEMVKALGVTPEDKAVLMDSKDGVITIIKDKAVTP